MMDIAQIHSQHNFTNIDALQRQLESRTEIREGVCPEEKRAIREAAEAFESYFIHIMLREMRRTIPDEGGLIPRSQAEKIFTDMLDEELAKEAARGGGIGLSDVIVQQLTRDRYMANMR